MSYYIFEDNENYILSQFLKSAYTQNECKHLIFADGNRKVFSKLKEVWRDDITIIVYLDVIPDNESTITEYTKIQKWISSEDLKNIVVLPIPSIEYYFIKAMGDRSTHEVDVAINFGDYKNTSLVKQKLNGVCSSFEIYCKAVLNHKMDLCKRPMSKSKSPLARSYYLTDCRCIDDKYDCEIESLEEKAWCVIRKLPVFYNGKLNKYFTTKEVDLVEREQLCIKQYNRLVDNLYDANIIKSKPYLQK